jgi:methylenetetrahydrofolate dehydrogenase (NADP+) / methenyltetrahydrofolate cyclohydrolase
LACYPAGVSRPKIRFIRASGASSNRRRGLRSLALRWDEYRSPAYSRFLDKDWTLPATILDGKTLAAQIEAELAEQVAEYIENNAHEPTLAAVLVGDDPASAIYVKNKRLACERTGIESRLHRLPAATTEEELLELVAELNNDDDVHGILVQLPLPAQIREQKVLDAVHPLKDIDCFHPENVGLLVQGRPRYIPNTPHGCLQMLHRHGIEISGRHAVVVGRSEIVGKPMATLLAAKTSHLGPGVCNATVTLCHSRTHNLAALCRQADLLIAAIGRPMFITGDMVKPGAVVLDVGINRTEDGVVGDVDFAAAKEVAAAITPVPRGIGPLTVTMLMHNTLAAARAQLV